LTFTYDLTTTIGQLRLKIGKLETAVATALFTDEELAQKLTEQGNNVLLAAAEALDAKADYIVEKKKVTTIGKYSINGAAMAAELRKRADLMRTEADNATGSDGFDVAELDEESEY